ncbi:hypothetical protein [Morganella morganii IS15]|nr:hypothetical protein CSB69_3833 [Morganella morganii]EMP51882.1 hypothetical protein C790_00781 [Morganella morganii SC01]CDK64172.1 hypothetical protein [Morganella morganii IS15]
MPESLFNIMKKHCISRFSAGEEPGVRRKNSGYTRYLT